jgi:hypothetical protein
METLTQPAVAARAQLQSAYELAFFPPRIHEWWRRAQAGEIAARPEALAVVELAMALHGALPESGYASQRALARLAAYQAGARAFGLPRSLRRLRAALGGSEDGPVARLEGWMVRDIGLPPFCRDRNRNPAESLR